LDLADFRRSLEDGELPKGMGLELRSLHLDGQGDWDAAHGLIDHRKGPDCSRIHAYLHRKEGDLANADFWYSRAGETRPDGSIEEEWEELVERFLAREG